MLKIQYDSKYKIPKLNVKLPINVIFIGKNTDKNFKSENINQSRNSRRNSI